MLLFLLALVVLPGPTPLAPFAADDGGGGAELGEEAVIGSGSGTLVRVCVVLGGRRGRDGMMMVMGSWWKTDGVEGRKEKEGRSASYCLSPGG